MEDEKKHDHLKCMCNETTPIFQFGRKSGLVLICVCVSLCADKLLFSILDLVDSSFGVVKSGKSRVILCVGYLLTRDVAHANAFWLHDVAFCQFFIYMKLKCRLLQGN